MKEQPLPLEGIRVITIEHAVAAPFATRQLADLGAEVIKVERREGDFARDYDTYVNGLASYFVWLNRGKKSLVTDLKSPATSEVMHALLENADILVQNLSPGASARLGIDYESLKDRYPRLIVCDITGYGEGGPYDKKKAYDLLIQAESGLVSLTGTPEQPTRVGPSIGDVATGMYTTQGCLAALVRRGVTGRGGRVQISMLDCLIEWISNSVLRVRHGVGQPPRMLLGHPGIVPYGEYYAGDGKQVILSVQNEREWVQFCKGVMGDEGLATDPRFGCNVDRVTNREVLRKMIEERFSKLDAEQACELLESANIANARLNDVEAVVNHPQLAARGRWATIQTEAGPVTAFRPPVIYDGPELPMGPVPALGAHTESVLRDLGFDQGDLTRLRAAGAI